MLDAFAGAERERAAVADAHATTEALKAEESALTQRRDEVRRRADYLRHVVAEIDRAKLSRVRRRRSSSRCGAFAGRDAERACVAHQRGRRRRR
jgi:hypothetical protein